MAVLVLSDLHLDKWDAPAGPLEGFVPEGGLDGVIVAGDLCDNGAAGWPAAVRRLRRVIGEVPLFLIPGNHEFYGADLRDESAMARAATASGAVYANRSEIVAGDVRFLCCTLWTDYRATGDVGSAMRAAYGLRDLERVSCRGLPARPGDLLDTHHRDLSWVSDALSRPFDGKTVLVTHHAPSSVSVSVRAHVDASFASDLAILEGPDAPDVCLHGHAHRIPASGRYGRVGACDVRNIALGYPFEVTGDMSSVVRSGTIHEAASPDLAETERPGYEDPGL